VTRSSALAPAQPIPQPPDFRVYFEPGEDRLLWERDRTHFPQQLTPLEEDFVATFLAGGLTHGFAHYSVPLAGARSRAFHGYSYSAFEPLALAPDEIAARSRRSEAALEATIARLEDLWEEEWLPEIFEHLAAMEALEPRAVPSTVGLVDVLECYWEHLARLWQIHFEVVFPAYVAVSEFEDLYRDLFGGGQFDAYRLLHGFPTRTFEVGCDLWRLSRIALRSPEVADVLATEAAADVPAALAGVEGGAEVLDELDRHLEAFGHRTATWGLVTPSFVEDPSPVLKMLKDYATQPDSASPAHELDRLARERAIAVAEAREALRGYPAPVVAQFEALLQSAQVGLLLTEDHGFYIDAYAVSLLRDLLSEMGRRLVADGILDDADDVLMLTYDDLRVAALDLPGTDPRTLVEQRRATLAGYADITPPAALGTTPAVPPPDNPLIRMAMKSAGAPVPSSEPGVVTGFAGSAGRVTAVARVVRSLAGTDALQPGEVLVAETTAPPWTPLFAVAAAVVTDSGGVLSHSAVVAREYGIPAVVGARTATAAIPDGALVEVDGDAGTVRVVG
jgi:phosphohistidine swiveling domain-containing protein